MSTIANYVGQLTAIRERVDTSWILLHAGRLNDIEMGQTFLQYEAAAGYVYDLLRDNGFDAELIRFPADGKTTCLDARMPMAWQASMGRLTVVQSPTAFPDPVAADYGRHPFHLIKGSTATPPGGICTRLLTEEQVEQGKNCAGCMVLLSYTTPPRPWAIRPLLDRGALGFVADYVRGGDQTPDCLQWVNAAVDDAQHWHVQSEDRDFIGFSVTPRMGRSLRQACGAGTVEVLVESDGRRYEGQLPAVTAVLPGKSPREIWVHAHLYEPLIADNSASVIMAIEALRQMRSMCAEGLIPRPDFSIRVVFAMECYGYAAMAAHFGTDLHDRALGAINLDCLPIEKTDSLFHVAYTPYPSPFYGNYILELCMQAYEKAFPGTETVDRVDVSYGDDTFLGDPTIGLPTVWPEHTADDFWHNSIQSNDFLDAQKVERSMSLVILWLIHTSTLPERQEDYQLLMEAALLLAGSRMEREAHLCAKASDPAGRMTYMLEGERRRLLDFNRARSHVVVDRAAARLHAPSFPGGSTVPAALSEVRGVVYRRSAAGFPFDQIRVPKEQRRPLPDSVIYGPLGIALACMDGKLDLAGAILAGLWECRREVTDQTVGALLDAVRFLEKAGYLEEMPGKA